MKIEISEQTFDVIQRMLNSDTFQINLNEAKMAAVAQQELEVAAQAHHKQKGIDAAIADGYEKPDESTEEEAGEGNDNQS